MVVHLYVFIKVGRRGQLSIDLNGVKFNFQPIFIIILYKVSLRDSYIIHSYSVIDTFLADTG